MHNYRNASSGIPTIAMDTFEKNVVKIMLARLAALELPAHKQLVSRVRLSLDRATGGASIRQSDFDRLHALLVEHQCGTLNPAEW